jgi:hypothetical protein
MLQPDRSASAHSVAVQKLADWKPPRGGIGEQWQREAYGYTDVIGELGYVVNLTANTVSSGRVVPSVWSEEDRAFIPTTDERVLRVWRAFIGPRGGQAELLRRAALHQQIAGECYLLGTPTKDERQQYAGLTWEFLSVEEIRIEGGGKVKRNSGGKASDASFMEVSAYVTRMWNSDARFSERAYSGVKRNLPICREIVVLTQVVDAIAKSRLAAGILFVPDEMSFGPEDEKENPGGDTDDIDEFTEELLEHLQAPVEDRTSAASLVPLILRGAAELGEKIRLIDVARDLDKLYMELRQEAIGRLGGGLDIPPEIMGGKAGLNHWTGYNIDADYIQKHVIPLAAGILDFITEGYLRPMLTQFEGMEVAEAGMFSLEYDPSPIMKRADAGPSARAAYDRIELSGEAYRRENGFDEGDAPSEEERVRRVMVDLLMRRPLELAPVLLPKLFPGENWEEIPELMAGGGGGAAPRSAGGDEPDRPIDEVVTDLETGQDEPDRGEGGDTEASLIDRLAVAADSALERALERAANRVISKLNGRDGDLQEQLRNLDRLAVLAAVPKGTLDRLGETPAGLLAGSWDSFAERSSAWIRKYLTEAGVEHFNAEDQAEVITRELVELLEMHALSSLRHPIRVGENGLRVPNELVQRALEASRAPRLLPVGAS